MGRKIMMHSCGIEDLDTDEKFDLVVMINVIEHCRDIQVIFEQIKKLLNPGGFFIYSDKMYDAEEELMKSSYEYDAGHPIRVDYRVISKFLDQNFDPVMHNIVTNHSKSKNGRFEYYVGQYKEI